MKPYVICHLCATIDGRILNDRWGKLPGPKDGGTLFETTAASLGIGAWLVGTTTMEEFAGRNVKLPRAGRFIANGVGSRLAQLRLPLSSKTSGVKTTV
jgi:hypothetical protein